MTRSIRFCLAIILAWVWSGVALAQDVADYVRITPLPSWVVPVAVPEFDAADDEGRESVWPLLDYQKRYGRRTEEMSYRYVVDLQSPVAVEEQGTITIDFDPLYESLELHAVSLTRGGRTFDAIDLSEAMVFRTETDRDQMIFNGTLTFSMPILDLRVGDRLSVQYSRNGRNPAIGEGFLARRTFGTTYEIKRRFTRVLVANGIDIHTKTINDPPEPEITRAGGWRIYQWDHSDPQVPDYDQNAPDWAYLQPTYEISNFESWGKVGDTFVGYYDVTPAARAAVSGIVAAIAADHETPKARARAALDWVQTNIRYVGLELGEGGFIPRQPARVLRRRFGDCKDVTLLLLALLDGLGVDADPMLVDLDERGGEFKGLPHPYAFNHIMVLAEIGGSLYPMDATRDPQTGTLDTMEKGDIEFGLRLTAGGSTVTKLPMSDYEYREVLTETFDLVSEPNTILYTLVFEEYGEDADGTLSWIAGQGEQDVMDGFVSYLADIYPTLEVDSPMEWEADEEAAMTRLSFKFRLPGYGGEGRQSLNTRAYQILAAMPSFEGGTRDAPFAIDHPRSVRHVRRYIGDDNYEFENRARTVETDAFRFTYRDTVDGHTLTEDYSWVTKSDHIKAKTFEDDMALIDKIADWNYTNIGYSDDGESVAAEANISTGAMLLAWLLLLGLPAGLIWYLVRPRREADPVAQPNAS